MAARAVAPSSRVVQSGGSKPYKKTSGKSGLSGKAPAKLSPASTSKERTFKLTYTEVQGDLFECPNDFCLAHCVSADMAMGKGIATLFKEKFKGVGELKAQGTVCLEVEVQLDPPLFEQVEILNPLPNCYAGKGCWDMAVPNQFLPQKLCGGQLITTNIC